MNEIERTIERFLDGELSPLEEARLRRHLRVSPRARLLLAERTQHRSFARRLPTLHVPSASLEESLLVRLRAEGFALPGVAVQRSKRRLVSVSGIAFALLLLVGLGRIVFDEREDPTVAALPRTGAIAPSMSMFHGTPVVVPNVPADRGLRASVRHNQAVTSDPLRNLGLSPMVDAPDRTGTESLNAPPAVPPAAPELPTTNEGSERASPRVEIDPQILRVRERDISPVLLPPGENGTDGTVIVAALQGCMSRMNRGGGLLFQEVQVRLGMETWVGGGVSVVVGSFPSVTETKHTNTSFMLSSPGGAHRTMANAPPSAHAVVMVDEVWGGVAVSQRVVRMGLIEVDAGGSFGSSRSSFRMSGELTVSHRVGSRFALEAGTTVTQVLPYDQDVDHFQVFNSPDNFVYNGASQRTPFYSIGLHAGLRTTIGN